MSRARDSSFTVSLAVTVQRLPKPSLRINTDFGALLSKLQLVTATSNPGLTCTTTISDRLIEISCYLSIDYFGRLCECDRLELQSLVRSLSVSREWPWLVHGDDDISSRFCSRVLLFVKLLSQLQWMIVLREKWRINQWCQSDLRNTRTLTVTDTSRHDSFHNWSNKRLFFGENTSKSLWSVYRCSVVKCRFYGCLHACIVKIFTWEKECLWVESSIFIVSNKSLGITSVPNTDIRLHWFTTDTRPITLVHVSVSYSAWCKRNKQTFCS